MNDKLKLIERIKKLLALSTSSNEHEAQMAAKKASDLMKEHQINMSQVDVDDQATRSMSETVNSIQVINRRWVPYLAGACARLFDGDLIRYPSLGYFSFVGFEEDTAIATELFHHLYKSWFSIVERDARQEKHRCLVEGEKYSGASFKNSHGLGYANSINIRVDRLIRERQAEVQASSGAGTALIICKKDALVEFKSGRKFKKGKNYKITHQRGLAAGQAAGQQAALGGAIS